MDVHPIPQNVTSFQFKLVGDMTLKQFGYLAAGSTTAYIVFYFFAHDYPLVSWPVAAVSALLGVSFAFLPIASRSLDYWLAAFLKAIYSPTKRTWQKNGKTFKEDPLFGSRLMMYLAGTNQAADIPLPNQNPHPSLIFTAPASAEPFPTKEELGKTVDLARQAQQLQMKIIQTERTLSQIKTETQKTAPIPVDYSQQVNTILANLQELMNQAAAIKQQIQSVRKEPGIMPEITPAIKEKIKVVIAPKPKQTQIALTTFPNVINGIVKDKDDNYLEGVVAVIYDKEGLPVRALKTNKLGQFTGSTPLHNGTYTLELEKDNFTFDILQLELTGGVLPSLLITAK